MSSETAVSGYVTFICVSVFPSDIEDFGFRWSPCAFCLFFHLFSALWLIFVWFVFPVNWLHDWSPDRFFDSIVTRHFYAPENKRVLMTPKLWAAEWFFFACSLMRPERLKLISHESLEKPSPRQNCCGYWSVFTGANGGSFYMNGSSWNVMMSTSGNINFNLYSLIQGTLILDHGIIFSISESGILSSV